MSEQFKGTEQSVILQNREELSVSGVSDVIGFDDETVVADTLFGRLTIKGNNLKVQSFAVETGSIFIKGEIAALVYTSVGTKKSGFKRLFG